MLKGRKRSSIDRWREGEEGGIPLWQKEEEMLCACTLQHAVGHTIASQSPRESCYIQTIEEGG